MTFTLAARRLCVAAALFLSLLAHAAAQVSGSTVLTPLPLPGPYPVGCSNVTQDFSRVAPGEDVQAYWEGLPRDNGTSRTIANLLSDPSNTLGVTVAAPNNGDVFGSYAGRTLSFTVLVCYPTTPDNPRPDYALPTGRIVPHMTCPDGSCAFDTEIPGVTGFVTAIVNGQSLTTPLTNSLASNLVEDLFSFFASNQGFNGGPTGAFVDVSQILSCSGPCVPNPDLMTPFSYTLVPAVFDFGMNTPPSGSLTTPPGLSCGRSPETSVSPISG